MNAGQILVAIDIAVDFAVAQQRGDTEGAREDHRAWLFTVALRSSLKNLSPALAKKVDRVVPDRSADASDA